MAYIWVVRAELQRLPISVTGFFVPAQAGQSMALQAKDAGIRYAGCAGFFRQAHGFREFPKTYVQQNGGRS